MSTLKEFWDDQELVGLVKEHFLNHLDELALERVYEKLDTQGIADAKEAIESAFKELDEVLSKKDKIKEPINMAR